MWSCCPSSASSYTGLVLMSDCFTEGTGSLNCCQNVDLATPTDRGLIAYPGPEGMESYFACFMENLLYFGRSSADRTFKLFLLCCGLAHVL